MKRKFLFFYLNTGAGHKSAAKVLSKAMMEEDKDVEIKFCLGFPPHKLGHIIFERGYNCALNVLKGAFVLIYDIGHFRFAQTLLKRTLGFEARRYLRHLILKEHPTDIVSFHFGLTPFLKEVLETIPWKINFTCIVTDPFTVPHPWFYERTGVEYFVYSEEAKRIGVHECGVPEENIKVIPFLMNDKFRKCATSQEVRALKIKHGFDPDKKIVLLVGGGEGLPGATEIINNCILHRAKFAIAVICGRDNVKRQNLKIIAKAHPKLDLHVYGFVDYLDELVKLCDCAVIKAGPATLMEVLSLRKPVVICTYIHNQELGNMHFAVRNHVGYFIRKPGAIFKKVNKLLNDANYEENTRSHFDNLNIDTDASKVARLLLNK